MPSSSGRRGPPILFIPALGVPVNYYSRMLSAWAGDGRHIIALELRGMPLTPLSCVRRQRYGYSALIRNDLPAVADALLPGAAPFIVVGHSLGGQLALLAAAARTIRPSAVVTIASDTSSSAADTNPFQRAGRLAQVRSVAAICALFGYWPGDRLGFGGRRGRSLMRDWCYEGEHGQYQLHSDATDCASLLSNLEIPPLLLTLKGDRVIPPLAATHLLQRLPPHADTREFPHHSHHFRWARDSWQPVTNAVDAWATNKER
ncbi:MULTISPECIES: alpha/beta fold hydrolase [unclassified Pseudoclavibacter]|uniref:alpha/beta fold hydrolase n=1 Tax=unclassified Pseudoclavibacter TaxID=2615177 RepID=UPI0015E438F7